MKSRKIFLFCLILFSAVSWEISAQGGQSKDRGKTGKYFGVEPPPATISVPPPNKAPSTDSEGTKAPDENTEGTDEIDETSQANEEQIVVPQESPLQIFQRDFEAADTSTKIDILTSAAANRELSDHIGAINDLALQFALQNSETNDPQIRQLISTAALSAVANGTGENIDTLWQVFSAYDDSSVRMEILALISRPEKFNKSSLDKLDSFLSAQSDLYRSGKNIDFLLVSSCIDIIARLGDSSSFPALFSVITSGYPEVIAFEAAGALDMINGNYRQFLVDVLTRNTPSEKAQAFALGMNSNRLTVADKGQLAEVALQQCLLPGVEGNSTLSSLRYSAVLVLTNIRWTRADELAVNHYYRVRTDYQQGLADKDRLLEAIACLSVIGNSRAALALALHLGLINSQTERNGIFDENITLAIITALGRIGDKSAFDYLTYVNSLNYTAQIKAAAREALGRLRW